MFIAKPLRHRHFGSLVAEGQSLAFDEPADRAGLPGRCAQGPEAVGIHGATASVDVALEPYVERAAAQADDPDSLLNSVKSLLAFRHAHADLNADAPFKVLYAPKAKDDYRPFVWQRGDLICAVNPAGVSIELPLELAEDLKIQYTIGKAEIVNDTLSLGAQSFAILG